MDRAQALHRFWSSFGLTAYDVNSVPNKDEYPYTEPEFPYITYEVSVGGFESRTLLTASLWYNSTSWEGASKKSDEIEAYIGLGGVTIPYDNGLMWIKQGSTFAQRMGDINYGIKRMLLSIEVENLAVV